MNIIRLLLAVLFGLTLLTPSFAQKPSAKEPPKVTLNLDDQYETKHSVADYKGQVLILVYGDRKGIDASRELGTNLHVLFHPSAEGKSAKEAKAAPVVALDGLARDQASPDVVVVPVAACAGVPNAIKGLIRKGLKKDAADTAVWLDFDGAMKENFGMTDGEANVVLIDGKGRLRMKVNGTPDKDTMQKLLQATQNLRAEIAGLR